MCLKKNGSMYVYKKTKNVSKTLMQTTCIFLLSIKRFNDEMWFLSCSRSVGPSEELYAITLILGSISQKDHQKVSLFLKLDCAKYHVSITKSFL